jgi:hypothetical protein
MTGGRWSQSESGVLAAAALLRDNKPSVFSVRAQDKESGPCRARVVALALDFGCIFRE